MMSLIVSLPLSASVQQAAMDYIDEQFGPNESQFEVDYSEKCELIMEIDGRPPMLQVACFITNELNAE